MKRISTILLALVLVTSSMCLSVFAHSITLTNQGDSDYKKVTIPLEVYGSADPDFKDFHIVDELSETIPYFVYHGEQVKDFTQRKYTLIPSGTKRVEKKIQYDYKMEDEPEDDISATSISFTGNQQDFVKTITLLGSYDASHWEEITTEQLYHVDSHRSLEIFFPEEQHYTHYRLEMEASGNEPEFSAGLLVYQSNVVQQQQFSTSYNPEFTVEQDEENKATHITLENIKNIPIETITLHTKDMFHRDVKTPFGVYSLYNLPFENDTYQDLTIPVYKSGSSDTLRLTIDNQDDKPITVSSITVEYTASQLVFRDTGSSSYTVYFGSEGAEEPPHYDIENYQSEILKQPLDEVKVYSIELQEEVEEIPEEPKDYQFLFNIIVVVIAILLAIVIIANIKKIKPSDKPE